ncbi:uncharacterized protein LOC131858912 [Cryptomeria japonica]|uniref:uncharacterized protein LOC131858912 n=1 Tax=Cryptomeria japonica TaxID=3369 RepID=UPI0027DA41DF|nr:uncharacterized protein LOC131858912 [Cryptomeria japonica]
MHQGLMVLMYDHLKDNQIAYPQPSISDSEDEGSDSDFSMGDESESDSKSETEESLEDFEAELEEEVSKDSKKNESQTPQKKKTKISIQKRNKQKRQDNCELELEDKVQRKDPNVDQKMEEITGEGFNQRLNGNVEQITSGDVPNNEQAIAGKSMVEYVDDLSKTVARAEEIRDAFNPRFEKVEKALEEIKTNDNAMDQRMAKTDNKFNKIEKFLKSIVEQSHNILKASADNTKILINTPENEKDSLELEPDMEGMGEVQGPRMRTRGKKKEKNPNKEIEELKVASTNYDQLVTKVVDLLKSL